VPTNREKQVIFALGPGAAQADGVPVLIFMVPEAGWEHMRGGRSHDFDLTKAGVPLKIVIGRCRTRADGLRQLEPFLKGHKVADLQDIDFSIGPGPGKPDA
jgi:hypothetical protein